MANQIIKVLILINLIFRKNIQVIKGNLLNHCVLNVVYYRGNDKQGFWQVDVILYCNGTPHAKLPHPKIIWNFATITMPYLICREYLEWMLKWWLGIHHTLFVYSVILHCLFIRSCTSCKRVILSWLISKECVCLQ